MRKFITIIFFLYLSINCFSCTIFTVKTDSNFYFCNNEDWNLTDPIAAVEPKTSKTYGYIVFAWDSFYPAYPQGGVNEKGLSLDWAVYPRQNYKNDPKKKMLDEDLIIKLLKNCATVEEAIKLIKLYNCRQFGDEHLLISDKENNSYIIEYKDDHMEFIPIKGNYQLITNFNISKLTTDYYSCSRYKAAKKLLDEIKVKSIEDITKILSAAKMTNPFRTINSYIIDKENMMIYTYYKLNFNNPKKINILKEIKKGKHIIKLY